MLIILHPSSPYFNAESARKMLEVVRAATRRRIAMKDYYMPLPMARLTFIEKRIRQGNWKVRK